MTLRIAVVGTGPAGAYAARHLSRLAPDSHITMIDRLATPWGLVRAGVAPDHQQTKLVTKRFEWDANSAGYTFVLNVELGRHVSIEELQAHFHAVVLAVGASGSRRLDIAGEDLPGCHSATDFVAWYNGHPDFRRVTFDLSGERAVIIGNGNVALDIARVLTIGVDALRRTDIADHALEALAASRIEEVVVLGRRGPAQAAFTSPELLGLTRLPGTALVIDPAEAEPDVHSSAWLRSGAAAYGAQLKTRLLRELAGQVSASDEKRIVLRFLASPSRITGDGRVKLSTSLGTQWSSPTRDCPRSRPDGPRPSTPGWCSGRSGTAAGGCPACPSTSEGP